MSLVKVFSKIGKETLRAVQFNNLAVQKQFFSVGKFNLLTQLKFTDKHEWIRLDGNIGTVGITDYAQDKLGEVVFVELPESGAKLDQAVQFATLESVKAVSECYMPAGGKVVEVNEGLKDNPSQINKAPFNEGWLVKVELTDKSEVEKLMDEAQYKEYLKSEDH